MEHTDTQVLEKAAVGRCAGKRRRRQGVASQALGLAAGHVIGKAGFNRVKAWRDVNKPNSGAVMRKCGMTCEGMLRQADRNNRSVCDIRIYATLASDWRKTHGEGGICKGTHD